MGSPSGQAVVVSVMAGTGGAPAAGACAATEPGMVNSVAIATTLAGIKFASVISEYLQTREDNRREARSVRAVGPCVPG